MKNCPDQHKPFKWEEAIQCQQNKKRTGIVIFVLRFDEKEKRKILKLMRGLRTTTTSDNKTQTTTIDFVSLLLNSNNDNIVNITLDDRCAFCQIMLFTLRLRVGEMGLWMQTILCHFVIFSRRYNLYSLHCISLAPFLSLAVVLGYCVGAFFEPNWTCPIHMLFLHSFNLIELIKLFTHNENSISREKKAESWA